MGKILKMFEVTTTDYGKGYVVARGEKSAFNRAKKMSPEKFIPSMTSHYDSGTKKELKEKYPDWDVKF